MNIVELNRKNTKEAREYLQKNGYGPILRFGSSPYWLVKEDGFYCRDICDFRPFKENNFISWYVYGNYHCDHCSMCWQEYSYEGDGDCGCYIYGDDLRDTCRLLPPIRWLIGWPRKCQADYHAAHEYDGIEEWYCEKALQDDTMTELLLDTLHGLELCIRDNEGKLNPIPCKQEFINERVAHICYEYESKVHPYVHRTIRDDWHSLKKRIWKHICEIPAPYIEGVKAIIKKNKRKR